MGLLTINVLVYLEVRELGAPRLNFVRLGFVGVLKLIGEEDCRVCGNQLHGGPLSAGCYGVPKSCLRPCFYPFPHVNAQEVFCS